MIGMFLARSLIGKYRHHFDLLARSFRTDEICTLIMLARSLIGKYWLSFDMLARSFRTYEICTLIMLARSLGKAVFFAHPLEFANFLLTR